MKFRIQVAFSEENTGQELIIPLGPYEELEEFLDEYLNNKTFPQDSKFINNTELLFKEALRTEKWVDILPETTYMFRFIQM